MKQSSGWARWTSGSLSSAPLPLLGDVGGLDRQLLTLLHSSGATISHRLIDTRSTLPTAATRPPPSISRPQPCLQQSPPLQPQRRVHGRSTSMPDRQVIDAASSQHASSKRELQIDSWKRQQLQLALTVSIAHCPLALMALLRSAPLSAPRIGAARGSVQLALISRHRHERDGDVASIERI